MTRILLIGYGNPGRLDDGLGPACAAAVEKLELPGVAVDADYQLTVEDAGDIAEYDVVVFADASVNGAEPFSFEPVSPNPAVGFSTHSVEPEAVLAMAHDMFKAETKGYALAIRGYEFNEFGERLSTTAAENLARAVEFIAGVMRENTFTEYAGVGNGRASCESKAYIDMTPADMN